jgi:hypothetical protein
MTYVIEADGPIPGDFSMISFGAVVVEPTFSRTFSGRCKPISERWVPEALAVSGHTRPETLAFPDAKGEMQRFATWLDSVKGPGGRLIFIADNNGFDWMFVCWDRLGDLGKNPFGFSSQNLGSLYKGLVEDASKSFKHLRKTAHTHDPVDDARGNAEALLAMQAQGLAIKL